MKRTATLRLLAVLTLTTAWAGFGPAQNDPEAVQRDYGRLISAGMGFQNGYLDGYELGVTDAKFRGRTDIQTSPLYQKADRGYSDKWRYAVVYQRAYREGFARGYSEGYAGRRNILIDRFYELEEDLQESVQHPPGPEPPPPSHGPVIIPAGTRILLELQEYLSTRSVGRGDPFAAIVVRDVYVGNALAVPETTVVNGRVGRVVRPGRAGARAELNLEFESFKFPSGEEILLAATLSGVGSSEGSVKDVEGTVQGRGTAGRDAATVAGTSAGGAVIGGIAGGGKGAGIGALVGGLIGLAGALSSKGRDIELPKGTFVEITLDEDLKIDHAPVRERELADPDHPDGRETERRLPPPPDEEPTD